MLARDRPIHGARPSEFHGGALEITIIGTGDMARGIATRTVAGLHAVTLVGRDLSRARVLAHQLPGRVSVAPVGAPLDTELVVLAVPYSAEEEVLWTYRQQLDGRVLVEVSNPLDAATGTPIIPSAGSAAAEVARRVPGARVVKAFNTAFAETLVRGAVAGEPLDVLIAADDAAAKEMVTTVASDGGLRVLDAGPLARARELEALGYLHGCLRGRLGSSVASAVKVVSEPVTTSNRFARSRLRAQPTARSAVSALSVP
jgi:predicted dinucleotide-binding enzyme